jgi:hypothetical protein
MNLKLLYQWMEQLHQVFSPLTKWQAVGLALFSYGIVVARHCQVSKVAEELGRVGRIPSVERRLRRWLANRRIDVQLCCAAWSFWVWRSLDSQRAVLCVDETKIADRVGVMMVSLAYEQRAIPLMWRCYRANSAMDYPTQGQVLLVWGLLAQVLEALPPGSRPLVQMDRGLGHSSAMLKALDKLGVDYLVRVKQTATFTSRRGHSCLLQALIKPGEQITLHGKLFRGPKQVRASLHLVWEAGQRQPWCLVTNDTSLRGSLYARRIWQEESFRDLKSGGWQWQCSSVTTPDHAQRLLLALALAYAWMLTQGTFILYADTALQREVFAGQHNRYSVFRSGLRFFKRMIHVDPQKICVGLFFAPHFQPLC